MKNEKNKNKKVLFIGLGIAAAGFLGYLGYNKYKKSKMEADTQADERVTFQPSVKVSQQASVKSNTYKAIAPSGSEFPLAKGSKGELVRALQQALIDKYGKVILPKAGADGQFGNEMIAALKKIGLPESISESTFNVITKGNAIDPAKVGETLYKSAVSKNFNQTMFTLRGMKSTNDYQTVSEAFQNYRIGGVRKTLVNGLLDSFTEPKPKEPIKLEFVRMGLKYNGSTWSLSGTAASRR
jgi:hypothetical protein